MATRPSSRTAFLVAGVTLLACTAEMSAPPGVGAGASNQGAAGVGAGPVAGGSSSMGAGGTKAAGAGSAGTHMAGPPNAGAPAARAPVFSRPGRAARLSKFEYQYSILDVLGVTVLASELDA